MTDSSCITEFESIHAWTHLWRLRHEGRLRLEPTVFHSELAQMTGGPVLVYCSGTGRRVIQLAKAGFSCVGIDISREFTSIARDLALQQGKAIAALTEFICADMRHVALDRKFGLVILDDWGFAYMLNQEDQLRCLESIRSHLAPEGMAIIDVFSPYFKLKRDGAIEGKIAKPRKFYCREEGVVVEEIMISHCYDHRSQVEKSEYELRLTYDSGDCGAYQYVSEMRHTYYWELEALLRLTKLDVVKRCADFEEDQPLHEQPLLDNVENDFAYLVKQEDA